MVYYNSNINDNSDHHQNHHHARGTTTMSQSEHGDRNRMYSNNPYQQHRPTEQQHNTLSQYNGSNHSNNYYPSSYSPTNRNRQHQQQQQQQQGSINSHGHNNRGQHQQHQQPQHYNDNGKRNATTNNYYVSNGASRDCNDNRIGNSWQSGGVQNGNYVKNFDKHQQQQQQHQRGGRDSSKVEPLTGSSHHNTKQHGHYHHSNNNTNNNNGKGPNMMKDSTHSDASCSFQHSYKKPVMPNRQVYLAMECEMVGTVLGDAVTGRVVLIDWKGRVVLDTYVNPTDVAGEITDYRTHVSGINAETLSSAPSFVEVRSQVQTLLQDKILVGHEIEKDLKALNIDHPWMQIRDTAYYQPFMQERSLSDGGLHNPVSSLSQSMIIGSFHGGAGVGAGNAAGGIDWTPRKLKELAKEKLQREIQMEGEPYCPIQDAIAALDLYKSHRPRWEACITTQAQKEQKKMNQNPMHDRSGGLNNSSSHLKATSSTFRPNNHSNPNAGGNEYLSSSHHSFHSCNSNYAAQQPPARSVATNNHINIQHQRQYHGNHGAGFVGGAGVGSAIPSNSSSSMNRYQKPASSKTSPPPLPTPPISVSCLLQTPPGFSATVNSSNNGAFVTGLDDSFSLNSASSHHQPNHLHRSISNSSSAWGGPGGVGPSAPNTITVGGNSSIILSSSFHSTSSCSTAFGSSSFHNGDCGGSLHHGLGSNNASGNSNFFSNTIITTTKNHDDAEVEDSWAELGRCFESGSGLLSGAFGGGTSASVAIGNCHSSAPGGVSSLLNTSLHGGASDINSIITGNTIIGSSCNVGNVGGNRSRSNSFSYLSNDVLAGLNELSLGAAVGTPFLSSSTIGCGGYMNPAQLYGKNNNVNGGKKSTSRLESSSIFSSASSFTDEDSCSSLDGNSFHDPSRDLF
jgi:DNA polymerase III epsilon subunit-like protein